VAICIAALVAPARAAAQEDVRTVVVITQQAMDPLTERALDAVETGLVDLPIAFRTERIAGWDDAIANRVESAREIAARTHAIAAIWLDLSAPQHVFLFISDSTGGRILVRNVRAETQDVEAQLETLSLIVRSSVKGLIAGGEIGVKAPPSEIAEAEPASVRLGLSLGYALQLFAPTEPMMHGARIELHVGLLRWLFVFAAYRLNLPVETASREIDVHLHTHPMELGLFGRASFSKWALDLGLSGVIDVVTFDVSSRLANVGAVEPKREVTAGVCPTLRVSRSLRSVVAVYFSVGVDIEALNHRYVVIANGDSKAVVAPWRFRPMFELGARFTVL